MILILPKGIDKPPSLSQKKVDIKIKFRITQYIFQIKYKRVTEEDDDISI